jgi:2-dehydro-3-deoxyphosphogluconate aldolase/(4S)-4-hydroxy-2-oxoglutarate aldolase
VNSEAVPWVGFRVIPLVVIDKADDIHFVMDALLAGGINVIEIGLRTESALDAIKQAVGAQKMVVAAGTVRTSNQVHQVQDAGVAFGISPSSSESMMDTALNVGLPFIPAIATLTEAQVALDRGFIDLKTYPTDLLGGEKFLRSVGAVMSEVRLIPAGGVSEQNLSSYLSEKNVLAVSGSWIASRDLIAARDFEEITKRAKRAQEIANGNG